MLIVEGHLKWATAEPCNFFICNVKKKSEIEKSYHDLGSEDIMGFVLSQMDKSNS